MVFRAFAIFGLTSKDTLARTVSEENRGYLALDIAMSSPFVCVGLAYTVVFLFTSFFDWKGIGIGIFILIVAILAAVAIWTRKAFKRFPKISILITIIGSLGLFFDLFKYTSQPFFWIVLWFSACCVYTVHFIYLLSKPGEVRSAPWERYGDADGAILSVATRFVYTLTLDANSVVAQPFR